MPSIDALSFDTTELQSHGEVAGQRVWFTAEGDGIGLNFFAVPPDLPRDIRSPEHLREFYASILESPASLVALAITEIANCPGIRLILKAPQEPSGVTYVGSLTIPFRDFSFVITVQCQEHGTSGVRETVLLTRLLKTGQVAVDDAGGIIGAWEPDDEQYDPEFPEHPLSRLRSAVNRIESSIAIDAGTRREPTFPLPTSAD